MDKIQNKFNETVFQDICDNGLRVLLIHKPGFSSSMASLATPFGAFDIHQRDKHGVDYHFQPGSAHFLEHKLFEDEQKDVLSLFSDMGANANAGTSYEMTQYYFSSSLPLAKPLNLLLDFVQSLSISDQSVEKEKGIIIQELLMYEQMADFRIYMETLKSLYHVHPLKYDIGGSAETVTLTTRASLEEAYRLNYHPSNMLLVVVTPEDPETIMNLVKDNQAGKSFSDTLNIQRVSSEEPQHVVRPYYEFDMAVQNEKVMIAYKLPVKTEAGLERMLNETALGFYLDMKFSTLNPAYQTWLDRGIINDYFGYDVSLENDYAHLLFMSEGDKTDELIQEIEAAFKEPVFTELELEQLKRRFIGSTIRVLSNDDRYCSQLISKIFKSVDLFKYIEAVEKIDGNTIHNALSLVNLDNRAIVKVKQKNSEN